MTQYSPTESAKVYEKSVTRKSNSKFNPKAIIQKLGMGTPPSKLDESAKRGLVLEYLEVSTPHLCIIIKNIIKNIFKMVIIVPSHDDNSSKN